ncbi:target of Myb1 membrane trafficking protein isoform X4 [Columba livia]|uniref:Target of myb1 membrane trafficking protein, transcript variant X3 n=2 Tax=Columba livia TaxID=8932 RepID=A0A2I0MKT5_COLLI|nr:target of Myb protein 1 isoform X3 [Columba livia]PKK30290.1 target of myb1 membrane trafficking protein, transcript variant X3 [Columba livia]
MEICDIINETEEGPKDAFRAIKKRIVGNKNFHEVMLALTVLETCVKNCGHRFHVLVSSQDFVEGVLVRIILPKNNPPTIVHDKVLTLIQSWADAFRSSPDLTGVVAVYEDLRRKGLEFPMTDLDMLSPIHTPQRTVYSSNSKSGQNSPAVNSPQQIESILHPVTLPAGRGTSSDAPITPTPEQIGKLRSELEVVNGNVKVMSEMLTELVPSQAEPSDLELLQELNRTCRAMQQRVLELIPRVLHEQLTEELLLINDNLNNVFLRYERFERLRTGQPVKAPNEAENSLIDLGPGTSSAVRQPEVTNNLSSQLAGMNLGSSSVSAALRSLDTSGKLEEEFDMFALTRGSSLAEQRKEVKYEDPQASKGLAGALDARQQNTGTVPVPQANFMEDIEKWLSTDVGESEDAKGVTSEEFDKFLEERAKVADRLPNLSSSSAGTSTSPPAASRHRKQEKEDDAMFAL